MKRIVKLFLLVLTCFFVFSLTSCKKGSFADATLVTPIVEDGKVKGETKEGEIFVGYYSFNEDTKTGTLYLEGSIIPEGQYEVVYGVLEKGEILIPDHGHQRDGFYFAGWYQTAEFINGQKVTSLSTTDSDSIIYAKYINLGDAGVVALICIAIVFLMLVLLCLIVGCFKYLPSKKEEKKENVVKPSPIVNAPQKSFTMADITDEDMMVAALIATIDYHNETNKDVRVVSIKQIG